jgi:hypothetical protein
LKNLNLVPKSYYLEKRQKKNRILNIFVFFIAASIVSFAVAYPLMLKQKYTIELRNQKNEYDTYMLHLVVKKQYDQIKSMFTERETLSKKIEESIPINKYSMVLEKIEISKPEKLFVVSLIFDHTSNGIYSVSMSGTAFTEIEVSDFILNLKRNKIFHNVKLNSLSKSGEGSFSFSINLEVSGG